MSPVGILCKNLFTFSFSTLTFFQSYFFFLHLGLFGGAWFFGVSFVLFSYDKSSFFSAISVSTRVKESCSYFSQCFRIFLVYQNQRVNHFFKKYYSSLVCRYLDCCIESWRFYPNIFNSFSNPSLCRIGFKITVKLFFTPFFSFNASELNSDGGPFQYS